MAFVSITRLHLRRVWYFPAFVWHTWRSLRQLRRSAGFLGGWLAGGPGRVGYWTITVWESDDAMRAFRRSGAHARAMPRLAKWCDEAALAHWSQPELQVPSFSAAAAGLRAHGRTSPLRYSSDAHARGDVHPGGQAPRGGVPVSPSPAHA